MTYQVELVKAARSFFLSIALCGAGLGFMICGLIAGEPLARAFTIMSVLYWGFGMVKYVQSSGQYDEAERIMGREADAAAWEALK